MQIIFIFIVGFLAGCIVTAVFYRRKCVGTLRIDTSDPDDGAYFFLEVDSGKAASIPNQKTILLTVDTRSYISHK